MAPPDGPQVPEKTANSAIRGNKIPKHFDQLIRKRSNPSRRTLLDGYIARRKAPAKAGVIIIWDTELAGFGLRQRPSGNNSWFVRFRERGVQKKVGLGRTSEVDAQTARLKAREALARIALDGLPKPAMTKGAPLFRDYVPEFLADCLHHWKPATQRTSVGAIMRELLPMFGEQPINSIRRSDILRWRDSMSSKQGSFNRSLPVLAAMLNYAERLGYCRTGSNPTRGTPRYKRLLLERYLTPREYARIGAELRARAETHPAKTAIVRLLLLTGARASEITDLRWEWVQPQRLRLPDSKTGPKTIFLNRHAEGVLAGLPRRDGCLLVFPNRRGDVPLTIGPFWDQVRRRAAIPDVRLHDIRHSFASTAIMDDVPLTTIGKILGHALHDTTARYAHIADDVARSAAQRISGSLASQLGLRL